MDPFSFSGLEVIQDSEHTTSSESALNPAKKASCVPTSAYQSVQHSVFPGRRELTQGYGKMANSTPRAAATPVPGSGSTSPAPSSPPQNMESMALELDNRCPICLDSCDNVAYVMLCLHKFCYKCILRWAQSKPECPLCKGRIHSLRHSVQADGGFVEHVIPPRAAPSDIGHQAGAAPGHPAAQSPAAAQLQPLGMVPRALPGGLHPRTWAFLFQQHPALLQPVQIWVHQELGRLYGSQSLQAATVEYIISPLLLVFGLNEDILIELLGSTLQIHTATFVHQLIDVATQHWSGEAHRLQGLEQGHAAREREGSLRAPPSPIASQGQSPMPGPGSSSSPEGDNVDDQRSTSAAALRGGPSSPPSAPLPIPGEQQEPQEEPEVAAPGPSSPRRGRERFPGRARRSLKRRATSSLSSSPGTKRPPHRQH